MSKGLPSCGSSKQTIPSIHGPSSRVTAVVPGPSDVSSVNHRLGLSDSDSWAEAETTGDGGPWPEKNNPTQSGTKRKKQPDPQNPATKRASEATLFGQCLGHTDADFGLDIVGMQFARHTQARHRIMALDSSPRIQHAKAIARAELAESVDDENGWTELLIEKVTPGNDPDKPLPSCTFGKVASLQQYFEKLNDDHTACLEEKDEHISSLELQLQELRKATGQPDIANEQDEQTQMNELAWANQKLATDLEPEQLEIDNRVREVETTKRELEAANKLLETRQQYIQQVEAERDSERQARMMQFDTFKQMFNLPPSLQLAEDTQHLVIQCFDNHQPLELRCFVMAKDCVVFSTLTDGTITQWTEESPMGSLFMHEFVPWFDIGIQRGSLRYLEVGMNPGETMKWLKDRYPMRKVTDAEARELD